MGFIAWLTRPWRYSNEAAFMQAEAAKRRADAAYTAVYQLRDEIRGAVPEEQRRFLKASAPGASNLQGVRAGQSLAHLTRGGVDNGVGTFRRGNRTPGGSRNPGPGGA